MGALFYFWKTIFYFLHFGIFSFLIAQSDPN